jgi:hypothetical protein
MGWKLPPHLGFQPQCGLILFTKFASDELRTLAQAAGVRAIVSKDVGGVDALVMPSRQSPVMQHNELKQRHSAGTS